MACLFSPLSGYSISSGPCCQLWQAAIEPCQCDHVHHADLPPANLSCPGVYHHKMSKPSAATRILALAALVASVAAGPADEEYLTGNAAQAGVTVLPSGLQYKVIASGPVDGPKPTPSQPCVCHYTGKLVSGYEFDSSRKRGRPATFKPSGVVKGWTEALQLMRPGDRWELVLPASLGYGERGAGGKIPGGATLIFDLELIEIAPPAKGLFTSMGLPFATVLVSPTASSHSRCLHGYCPTSQRVPIADDGAARLHPPRTLLSSVGCPRGWSSSSHCTFSTGLVSLVVEEEVSC